MMRIKVCVFMGGIHVGTINTISNKGERTWLYMFRNFAAMLRVCSGQRTNSSLKAPFKRFQHLPNIHSTKFKVERILGKC